MKKDKRTTIVLLDAHAILHRGYHAMAGFATRDGRPTGALYGFIMMALRIYEEIQPDYIAACFDLLILLCQQKQRDHLFPWRLRRLPH